MIGVTNHTLKKGVDRLILENLEEAQKLAQTYYEKTDEPVVIELNFSSAQQKTPHRLWVNYIDYDYCTLEELLRELQRLNSQLSPKLTIGLFGNEVQNQEMQRILNGIYARLDRLEQRVLSGEEY